METSNSKPTQDLPGIVANGGWVEQKLRFQKKALIFKFLAVFWIVPSLGSSFVIYYNFPVADGVIPTILQIRFEQWLSLLVLLVHPFLIRRAIRYRRTEIAEEHTVWMENPAHDLKKLY